MNFIGLSFMRQMDVNEYRGRVYRNTMKQMLAIYCTLCNLNLNLEKEPFKDNYLVGEVYLSELTLKALEEMKTVIDMIPTKEVVFFRGHYRVILLMLFFF